MARTYCRFRCNIEIYQWPTSGTREVVYCASGAALNGVLSADQSAANPRRGGFAVRPGVAIVFFFGLAFVPWGGLFTAWSQHPWRILPAMASGSGGYRNGMMGLVPA
jgi:hypothetical protein